MKELELLLKVTQYFKEFIFLNHVEASLGRNSKLSSYKVNPILVKYLSTVLVNDYTPDGVAKALYYPRVLGTSINTSFGQQIQKMFVNLKLAKGSMIKGMDIEFNDRIDNRKKWCQLKSGPNTINSEDVNPLIDKFTNTIRLAKTNDAFKGISNTDFIVGVLYGDEHELSMHYKKIDLIHPVIIGKDFWHRVTGFPNFYERLVVELNKIIENIDTKNLLEAGCNKLSEEIKNSELFDF